MIMMLTERPIPAGVNFDDDAQAALHCRIAVDAMARTGGRMQWVCSYVTDDRIVGVTFVESEADVAAFQRAAGVQDQPIKVSRVRRRLDPGLAGQAAVAFVDTPPPTTKSGASSRPRETG